MAVSKQVSMLIDLYKNNNTASKTYGQYYGYIFKRKGLNLKGFARHISEHGSLVTYDLAVLVMRQRKNATRSLRVSVRGISSKTKSCPNGTILSNATDDI